MANDDKQLTNIADLEKARNQRQLTDSLRHLVDEARAGKIRCFASRMYYKDGTSELIVAGGTPEEQAEVRARLEAMEAEMQALMAEIRPMADEIFVHLPEEDRLRVFDSPERTRLAFKSLPDNQRTKLAPLLERLRKYEAFLEELSLPVLE